MKKYLVDLRCPQCNAVVMGREEVVHKQKLPPAHVTCPTCKAQLVRAEPEQTDLGMEVWYTTKLS